VSGTVTNLTPLRGTTVPTLMLKLIWLRDTFGALLDCSTVVRIVLFCSVVRLGAPPCAVEVEAGACVPCADEPAAGAAFSFVLDFAAGALSSAVDFTAGLDLGSEDLGSEAEDLGSEAFGSEA